MLLPRKSNTAIESYDAWKLVAAQAYGIDYAEVTQEQRDTIKREAFYRAFGGKYYGIITGCFISSDDSGTFQLFSESSN